MFQFLANPCYSPNWSLGNIKDTGVILSPLAFCEGNFLTSWMMNVRLLALIQVLFQVLALVQVLFQILVGGLVKFSAPKADQCSWYWSRPTAEKRFINLWKWKGSKLSTWQFWTEIDWVKQLEKKLMKQMKVTGTSNSGSGFPPSCLNPGTWGKEGACL